MPKVSGLYVVTGFLLDFSDDRSAGESPMSAHPPAMSSGHLLFPDQKQTAVAEDCGSHIDLGCCVPNIHAEEFDKRIRAALPEPAAIISDATNRIDW